MENDDMDIGISLFEGGSICLAPIDHDKDAEIESRWTHDPEYLRLLNTEPARPASPAQIKKRNEAIEKDAEENKNLFHFTIRMRADDRLIGFARIQWIEWTHGNGWVKMGIGSPSDRGQGYGSEALRLLLRYAFAELNLFRLSAVIPEYNPVALHMFKKAGFVEEVCRRQALNRDGRRWDLIYMGLLREEWEKMRET
jgi:RimJ/RimL family protein N-acetyltransferase